MIKFRDILEKDAELKHFIPMFQRAKTVRAWNKVMSRFYDYCDENSIWVN